VLVDRAVGVEPGDGPDRGPPVHEDLQYTTERILAGSRLYAANCQLCHGRTGDGIGTVNLARQKFRRAITDDDIRNTIHGGVISAGMPTFESLTRNELDALVAYIRSGFDRGASAFRLGDAARGKALYKRSDCANCHLPKGNGPQAAPTLANIGSLRLPSEINATILDPTKTLRPINRGVHIVTQDGRSYRGRRLNEDTYTVLLVESEHGGLVAVPKDEIRTFEKSNASSLPAYAGKFSELEMADLLAYLISLKGD
jgi:putative heme-binding domain-containing protein